MGAAVAPRPYSCAEGGIQLFRKHRFGIVCGLLMVHLFQFENVRFPAC